LRRAQNEFGLRIKKIRSDNGTEFKNSQTEGGLEEEGIKHEFSSPYTPQQNGVVERKNRTLLDMARTMLDEYKTSDRFWAEAVNTACYAINRLYLHRILKKTSYELLTGKKPNISYFRVFGSKCFILVKRGRKSKFVPKTVEGFLLGYDSNTRTYRVFNKSSGQVEVSCDVVGMCVLRNPKSLQMHKINHPPPRKHLHQLKMRMRLKLTKKKIKKMSHLKMTALIKGEMPMIKIRKMNKFQGRHTQESTKQSNEITPLTPSSATFKRG
jgi:hypothetical protein